MPRRRSAESRARIAQALTPTAGIKGEGGEKGRRGRRIGKKRGSSRREAEEAEVVVMAVAAFRVVEAHDVIARMARTTTKKKKKKMMMMATVATKTWRGTLSSFIASSLPEPPHSHALWTRKVLLERGLPRPATVIPAKLRLFLQQLMSRQLNS